MGSNKLPYFPFHAQDWLSDPVVAGMSAEAEGCYIRLLARSWLSETPGRVPAGLAPEFGGMHRVPDKDERPYRVLEAVRAAFDTKSEKGVWIQRRMVREYERLAKNYDARVAGALKTLGMRAQPSRSPSRLPSRSPGVEVEVEVDREVEESKSKDLATDVAEVGVSSNGTSDPEDLTWGQIFETWFWERYPRKVGRPAAKKAWAGVRPQNQETVEAMNEGLGRWQGFWAKKDKEFIPHPATWLNQRRWEDQP